MKKLLILFSFVFLPLPGNAKGFDMTLPVNGDSIANDYLQSLVMTDIYHKLNAKYVKCFDYFTENTEITKYPYDVKKKKGAYVKGYWAEMWTVNVCGKKVQVPVSYIIKKKTTLFFVDENLL